MDKILSGIARDTHDTANSLPQDNSLQEETNAAEGRATPARAIVVSPETLKQAGHTLFLLWLKIAATLLLAKFVVLIWPVLILLLLSLMMTATLSPLVRRLQAKWSRGYAVSTVVFAIVGLPITLLIVVIPPLFRQASALLLNLPQYITQIEEALRRARIPVRSLNKNIDLSQFAASLGPETLNFILSFFNGVTGLVTVVVLTTYLLIDGERLGTRVLGWLPRDSRLPARRMFGEIGNQVGDYMRGQLIISAIAGAFCYVMLLIAGVPEPLALSFVMAVGDAVPIVGAFLGALPAVLMAMTQSAGTAIWVFIGFVVYQQIENHWIVPRVYGNAMKLSSFVVVLAILIGVTLMGVLGALLALPVAAAVPILTRYIQDWQERDEETQIAQDRVLP